MKRQGSKRKQMPGKSLSPDQLAEAVALRTAGFTVAAIASRLGFSVRTISRVFERHRTRKGAATSELIEQARQELMSAVTSPERVREEAARLVADDLAHARLLRAKIAS